LARRLAQEGWQVAASARTARDLDSLAAEVEGRITAFQLDVTDEKACAEVARHIVVALGPVDLAVFNAGTSFPTTAENFSVANFRKTIDVNLMGEVNCMGAVVPAMIARRSGHIVLMGSLSAFIGAPAAAAYGASKAAINRIAEAFNVDFGRFGVVVSVINPGFVRTPLTDRNKFPMPFLMDVDTAVDHIMRGIARAQFEIAFPWQMSLAARLLAALPNWAKLGFLRRGLPR
jgi:NAD(P)-dependent dehydrogenase (short-subunit alcohol dehydrogenase family)